MLFDTFYSNLTLCSKEKLHNDVSFEKKFDNSKFWMFLEIFVFARVQSSDGF